MSAGQEVIVLERSRIARLVDLDDCIRVVEQAFRLRGEGQAARPAALGLQAASGAFHVKAALLDLGRPYFVAKANANFPDNPRAGLPTIQGMILLSDGRDGRPLAVMDSIEITMLRTAAATAVAAKYLARSDSRVLTICGCGVQGQAHLRALRRVLPIERVFAYDRDGCRSNRFANDLHELTRLRRDRAVGAARASDVASPARPEEFLLHIENVQPGTFVDGAELREARSTRPHGCAWWCG
jgi:ornithine cyclodeaminase/alanine dehydrogenase-like protein (mu-crystallin family)